VIAPFDEQFFLVLNVAVGGTGGYFPGMGSQFLNSVLFRFILYIASYYSNRENCTIGTIIDIHKMLQLTRLHLQDFKKTFYDPICLV
jgi:hypothetical protein